MSSSSTLNYLKKPFRKFSNLKLSKKSKASDELPDITLDNSELFTDDLTLPSNLSGFKGNIDDVVSQYFNQSPEYDYYKDLRDTNDCRFTTFKTPALPKKTLKINSQTTTASNTQPTLPVPDPENLNENQHLDVKFQLTGTEFGSENNLSADTAETISEFQALDNPLYLSLNECSTGSQENIDHLYENASAPDSADSDDDHIYENVETHFNLYDTVSNPPRPKLPPKPGQINSSSNGFGTDKKKRQTTSAIMETNPMEDSFKNSSKSQKSFSKSSNRIEEKLLVRDGSETSDLGSSGSEDTISEEDWPLPPVPSQSDLAAIDIPFPPPPLELALQQLEEDELCSESKHDQRHNLPIDSFTQEDFDEPDDKSPFKEDQDGNYDFLVPQLGRKINKRKNEKFKEDGNIASEKIQKSRISEADIEESLKTGKGIGEEDQQRGLLNTYNNNEREENDSPSIKLSDSVKLNEIYESFTAHIKSNDTGENINDSLTTDKNKSNEEKNYPITYEHDNSKRELFESQLNGKNDVKVLLGREESLKKKHWKNKISTISKGLNVYNEVSENNQHKDNDIDVQFDQSDLPSIRHSVVIELKDPVMPASMTVSPPMSKEQPSSYTFGEKENGIPEGGKCHDASLPTINSVDDGSVCLEIKQENFPDNEKKLLNSEQDQFNDQIIEISDDGSWEMKDTLDTSGSSPNDQFQNIDPFTGQPIQAEMPPLINFMRNRLQIINEINQPAAYFECNKPNCDVIFDDKDDVYSAACVTTISGASSLSSTVTENTNENYPEKHRSTTIKEVPRSKNAMCDASRDVAPNSAIHMNYFESGKTSSVEGNEEQVPQSVHEQVSHTKAPQPRSSESAASHSTSINIGAAIMAEYEKDFQKMKENLNLPEVSLLEFGDSVKDLEIQRKDVIQQMTVKAKRKDSWIRTFRPSNQISDLDSNVLISGCEQVSDLSDPQTSITDKKKLFENGNNRKNCEDEITPISNSCEDKENVGHKFNSSDSKSDNRVNSYRLDSGGRSVKIVNSPQGVQMNKPTSYCDQTEKLMKQKNKANFAQNCIDGVLGKCFKNNTKKMEDEQQIKKLKGEVDDRSILEQKEETRSYWETKMLAAVDDGGWEPVANVRFQSDPLPETEAADETTLGSVPPPPEFSVDNDLPNDGNFSSTEDSLEDFTINEKEIVRPTRQYMYGADQEVQTKIESCRVETRSNKPSSQENVIEAEIREQQLREEALRRESGTRSGDKSGGASSPSSHTSDEGFVDRSPEEIPSPPSPSSSHGGYTHTLRGLNGEPVIYDAVSPPSQFFTDKNSAIESDSETKIALEIRELKEREAELRAMREMREKEQELRAMRVNDQRTEDLEEFVEENGTSKDLLDDHLISLTTTTDEGNFSECGETNSSEDKSSDGSNSRIVSPDFQSYGSHSDIRQRKPVTVKPFEDEESEEQPVYTRMKKESVIEREIRLAREREEAYRREKGLLPLDSSVTTFKLKPAIDTVHTNGHDLPSPVEDISIEPEIAPLKEMVVEQPFKRGVQHRIATNRIQLEIEETAQRERELKNTGQIRTLSEDTVDAKVTRLADLATEQNNVLREKTSRLSSPSSSSLPSAASSVVHTHTLPHNKRTPSPGSSLHQFTQPSFSSSSLSSSSKLTRSLSTNNLSMGSSSGVASNGMRAPQKGLMEKFFASRGKITGTTFLPHVSSTATLPPVKISSPSVTTNGVHTRPMKVMPKAAVIRRDVHSKEEVEAPKVYRRTHATAEEKIQEELREMKHREEELRRLRVRTFGRSHPNLAGLGETEDEDEFFASEGVDSSPLLNEINGELRNSSSNPNLLDVENEQITQAPVPEKNIRRRSALIAQWEGRIQQTSET